MGFLREVVPVVSGSLAFGAVGALVGAMGETVVAWSSPELYAGIFGLTALAYGLNKIMPTPGVK